ncbi:MAG: glycosyltransferase family 1 protein [Bacteroidetes bacterium]|nr:glycosyltransferase family 1 protein [Bacteroidota bacterium]
MNIAYFNANLKIGQDGVSRVVHTMIEGALERNHSVIAITSTAPKKEECPVPVYEVPSVVFPLHKAYRLAIPTYRSFAKYTGRFRPDIIHINSPCTLGLAALKYALHYQIPVVATYHTHFPTYPRYYGLSGFEEMTWKIIRSFYNQMDCTFVPTLPILSELRDHAIEKLVYLPNGVDTTIFSPHRRSEHWRRQFGSRDVPIVLFVSRLVWEKNLRVLADAYQILRERDLSFEMVVIGDGHARSEFESMMPGAHFLGYHAGLSLAESYASSDIFVFPSVTETFGLVTVEAMASGLVPIAAKAGGAAEIIEDGISGLFAQPNNAYDLAAKVEFLITHPDVVQTMRQRAWNRAQEYSWKNILDRLFKLYEVVIEEHQSILKQRKAA